MKSLQNNTEDPLLHYGRYGSNEIMYPPEKRTLEYQVTTMENVFLDLSNKNISKIIFEKRTHLDNNI